MSGAQTSGFPNVLFNAPAAYNAAQQYQDNQLLMQQHQQAVTDHDIAAVGQAAAPLLGMSEDDAAKAYPGWLQDQQSRGIAKYAPQSYPGHAAVQALVQRAMPLMDQFKLGYITPSGTQAAIDAALRPGTTGTTGGGAGTGGAGTLSGDTAPINAAGDSRTRKAAEGGPPAAGTPGAQVAQQVHDFWISKGFSEPVVAGIMAGGPGSESDFTPTAVGDKGTSIGLYQHHGPRADAMRQFFGLSPGQMPTADQQNQYAHWEITQGPLKNVGAMLQAAKTPAEAAAIWTQYFGVPADKTEIGRRAAGAQRFVGLYGGQPGAPGSSTAPAVVTGDVARPGDVPPPPGGAPGAYGGGGFGAVVARPPVVGTSPIPAGRPTGPPVVTDQPAGSNVVAGPPGVATVGTPQPPGPAVAGNVAAINAGIVRAGGQPAADPYATPARYAGTAPAPSVEAPPETGWGSQVGSGYGPQNALAPPLPPAPPAAQPVAAAPAAAQPQAQVPQPPANRVTPGSADGPPASVQQQPPPGARANLPRAADIPTGVNSQQYRDAADLQRRALILEAQVDPTGRLKQLAGGLRQQAQLLLQTDSVVQTQDGQLHPLTGKLDEPAKPLPHYVYDPTQHAYIDTTGTNKPEFEPAQRDSAVAQRDVMELGPKVANGTATPQEQARYATAVETYRQPVLRENPVTKETVRVNTRELPAGFPEPTGLRGTGAPGGAGASGGSNVVIPGYSPQQQEIERNKGRYDIAADDLKHDRGEIAAIGDAGRSAQQDNLRVQEMRDILTNANTGPGTETAAHLRAWVARWTPGQLAAWDGSGANLSNPAAIEMFQKLGFVGAVTQERGSTPRGGYQATKMFQQFNPGAQLLTSTNQGLLAQRLIANQAEADYAQAAQDHYNTQRERLKSPEQNYDPLSSFDAKWQAQRNPQVYAAAIGALGGQDGEMWSRGLSKDEIQRVKDVVARADPKAVVNMPGDAPTGRNRPPLTSFQR